MDFVRACSHASSANLIRQVGGDRRRAAMRKTKRGQKRPSKKRSVKSGVDEVWNYLERQRSLAENEGNFAAVRYLDTCVSALLICEPARN